MLAWSLQYKEDSASILSNCPDSVSHQERKDLKPLDRIEHT